MSRREFCSHRFLLGSVKMYVWGAWLGVRWWNFEADTVSCRDPVEIFSGRGKWWKWSCETVNVKAGSRAPRWDKSGVTHLPASPGAAAAPCGWVGFAVGTTDVDVGHLPRGGTWSDGSKVTREETCTKSRLPEPSQWAGATLGSQEKLSLWNTW